ncbi:YibE/F family protein [Candidatus Nomurabacteria bacterium]|nr:YibE/F family protein [Candidatus Nomurabacteria bacterium]
MPDNYPEHEKGKPNIYAVLIILALSLAGIMFAFSKPLGKDIISGRVMQVLAEREITLNVGNMDKIVKEQDLRVEIMSGKEKKEIQVLNDYKPVAKGDKIFLRGSVFRDNEWDIDNVSRVKQLVTLLIFFVALVIFTSGFKGFYSLIGLLFTFAVIFAFMVPQILEGASPVTIGTSGAALVLIPALYLSYGFNKKSIAAFLGIIISLVFVGLASNYFINSLGFTGAGEASLYLDMATKNSINLIGLIIAGIIIAAVGVLDDVAAIQASVVFSLSSANPNLRGFKLFKEAMLVGKDHIGAVVNTLVLAYTGASLPLILLLYIQRAPLEYFVSLEAVAEEIARTLISSSGLLLAVPLTTLIATFMIKETYVK